MASPSRPSVQVHRVAGADDDRRSPKITKNQPRLITSSLKNGNTSEVENGARPNSHKRDAGDERDGGFDRERAASGESGMRLLGDFQIVVVEADQAEAERHARARPRRRGCDGLAHSSVETSMPDRIIRPPMVGVPALAMMCDCGPSVADRLALALQRGAGGR